MVRPGIISLGRSPVDASFADCAGSRACSSVDRALGSGPKGRRFESCRARSNNIWQRECQTVLVGSRREAGADKLGTGHDDPLINGVNQVRLLRWHVGDPDRLTDGAQPGDGSIRRHTRLLPLAELLDRTRSASSEVLDIVLGDHTSL